jgi:hypothetical protein|tara:strand:+ start:5190 stop:5369 length:180 start_codon:yes stop_codon:yes gene_type:complete
MAKIKLTHCSICQKKFVSGDSIKKKTRFDGVLGIIPLSLHRKCYDKLMKFDELILSDNE